MKKLIFILFIGFYSAITLGQVSVKGVSLNEKAHDFAKLIEPNKNYREKDISPETGELIISECEFAGQLGWNFRIQYLKPTKDIISFSVKKQGYTYSPDNYFEDLQKAFTAKYGYPSQPISEKKVYDNERNITYEKNRLEQTPFQNLELLPVIGTKKSTVYTTLNYNIELVIEPYITSYSLSQKIKKWAITIVYTNKEKKKKEKNLELERKKKEDEKKHNDIYKDI